MNTLRKDNCPDFPTYQKLLHKHRDVVEAQKYGRNNFFLIFQREYRALKGAKTPLIAQWAEKIKRSADD